MGLDLLTTAAKNANALLGLTSSEQDASRPSSRPQGRWHSMMAWSMAESWAAEGRPPLAGTAKLGIIGTLEKPSPATQWRAEAGGGAANTRGTGYGNGRESCRFEMHAVTRKPPLVRAGPSPAESTTGVRRARRRRPLAVLLLEAASRAN